MTSKNTVITFPIVGIGASAGGLEAFEDFFHHMPVDSGMAFVLVPHLDPGHASLLTEILQRVTTLRVTEALDQLPVEPNCVYIIPPNRDMAIFHGSLQLTTPDQPRGQRMPIDAFLRSLAEDAQEDAIGIVLSGTGSDGTLGLRAILGAGGVTLVQEPSTAKYDGMPTSAIQAGYASHVASVDKMPEILASSTRHVASYLKTVPVALKSVSAMSRILMLLRTVTGNDFSLYKQTTITRRIERRMVQHAIEDIDIYARYLKENSDEVRILFKDLLINVTNFFRDPEAFIALQTDILPSLCPEQSEESVFRAWVPGCATGEEAYSIAILLRELMDETQQIFKVQIYATDLAEEAISVARAGLYPFNIAQDVTPARLRRYFNKEETGYRVSKDIRDMVIFALQNVIKDPPFTRLDLLSCRNLMIYLEPELQNRLLPAFHYALKPNGVLMLSPSESVGSHLDLFTVLNRKWKLYRAIPSTKSSRLLLSQGLSWTADRGLPSEQPMEKNKTMSVAEFTQRTLLQYFVPASVVTDLTGNILYVHGDTGKYLRPAPGHASLNVVEMAREGLELELRAAIYAAVNSELLTLNRELDVKTNGGFSKVSLSVRCLPGTDANQSVLLISFQDVLTPPVKPTRKSMSRQGGSERIEELERELVYLKESYQVIIEEPQASSEELKSTNEEMQSTNEELQSTNEELETSKEELQSVNEELITVNSELQMKIEQLAGMQNDMKNLLDNINVGIIFLDRELMIRSFTREAVRVYRLVASDVGRSLSDIRSLSSDADGLLLAAQGVLTSLIPYEQELCIGDDTWMLVRIQPYRTLDNFIDGVVLTFTDISTRVHNVAVKEILKLADSFVNTVHEPLMVLDGALVVISASSAFYQQFQVTPEETVGRRIYALGNQQWDIPALRKLLEEMLPRDGVFNDYVVEHNFPVIGYRKMLLNARCVAGTLGKAQLILLSIERVSEA